MAMGAFPPVPWQSSPDFLAWLDQLVPQNLPKAAPIPEEASDE